MPQTRFTALPRVRVIIVNYNGGPLLSRVVAALAAQTMPDFEAVIVDNASLDGSVDGLPLDARFTLVRNADNAGFARGNNQAGLSATTAFIACLNPDAVPQPDWLEQLLRAADAHPVCDFFGSTQLRLADPTLADGLGDHLTAYGLPWRSGYGQRIDAPYPDGEVFSPCAAASMYRTARFKQLGGFAEDFFCYVEDVELAYRHRLQGGTVRQVGAAIVHHHGSAISGVDSAFSLYHGLRNMIWTVWRCTPAPLLFVLPLNLAAFFAVWGYKSFQYGLKLPHRAIARALVDAFKGLPRQWRIRQDIQAKRSVSACAVARMLSWNPVDALKHR